MKTKADFEPDTSPPRSIRELVIEQLDYTQRDGKTVPINSVEELLQRVYEHIEQEAIKRFKSNKLWAVRTWAYENILQDSAAKGAAATDESLLDEMVSEFAE